MTRPARAALLALSLLVAPTACGADQPLEAFEPLPALTLDSKLIEDARIRAEESALRKENQQRGWECGYQDGWARVLFDAREKAPLRWRGRAVGSALVSGLVLFGLGLVGTFLLAFLMPRWRRRRQGRPQRDDHDTGWLAFLREGVASAFRWLGKVLRVDYFDRSAAEARVASIHECLETERQLVVAELSTHGLGEAGAPEPAELEAALDAWIEDIRRVRARLEDNGLGATTLQPTRLLPTLTKGRRAAHQIRVELARAELANEAGAIPSDATWQTWSQLVEARPPLPTDRATKQQRRRTLKTWVRPVGWAGVATLALAVPMDAAWTAAGAFPLFFALLFSFVGLGAVLTARIHLFQAGRLRLLPGLADRLARVLTWLALLTTALLVASSMATAESGLDLGDPPPIETPAPADMQTPPLPPLLPAEVPK